MSKADLTYVSKAATLLLPLRVMIMRDTPQREPSTKLHRVLAAHRRRARIIAQLHEQAIAASNKANNDLSAQHKAIKAGVAEDAQRRKAEARLFFVGAFVLALGCIIAVGCVLALWP